MYTHYDILWHVQADGRLALYVPLSIAASLAMWGERRYSFDVNLFSPKDFYTAPHLTAGAWCQPAREVAGRDVTACRPGIILDFGSNISNGLNLQSSSKFI